MNKLIIATTLLATAAAALPANAAPRNNNTTLPSAQSTIQVGNQCFRPTDGRGYGYWTSCDKVYTFVLGRALTLKNIDNEVRGQIDRGSDGGGGDGGSGGGGGQR